MSIFDKAPKGMSPREWQVPVLTEIERCWSSHDVFIIPAPVAFGKSFIAAMIGNWQASKGLRTGIITPRVDLQEQYKNSFEYMPVLKGRRRYECNSGGTCFDTLDSGEQPCPGCPYSKAKKDVATSKVALYNTSSYNYKSSDDKDRDIVIVDEAHLLVDFLFEEFTINLWKHKEHYPDNLSTAGDVGIWLEGQIRIIDSTLKGDMDKEERKKLSQKRSKLSRVRRGVDIAPANFFVERSEELYFGARKERLRIRPTTLRGLPDILWNNKTTKIILMSATINTQTLDKLGIGTYKGQRVKTIECSDPIPSDRHPIYVNKGVNMSYKYQDNNIPKMAKLVEELLENNDSGGICHMTYGIANKLKHHLSNDRLIWHTPDTREEALQEFNEREGSVLMGCGMGEGLDLAGPKFGWQAILKIPYPSMKDMLIAKWYREDYDWILWTTTQLLIQQCGRICRDPEDLGKTYVLDTAAGNLLKKRRGLLQQSIEKKMVSKAFIDRLNW